MLSGDVEARINVDNLLDDEDLEKDFTLKEFEELISGYKQRLVTLIQETLQELQEKYNFNKEHLWRIELLGDTSRTPCFMKIIKDEFAMADLNRTMHSQEYLARGLAAKVSYQKLSNLKANIRVKDQDYITLNIDSEEMKEIENAR